MSIPSNFKGKVWFYWSTKYERITVSDCELLDSEFYVLLGEKELAVEFDPKGATTAVLGALEKQAETIRAEYQRNLKVVLGQIQSLQALEHVA